MHSKPNLPALYQNNTLAVISDQLALIKETVDETDAEKWFEKGLEAEKSENWEEALYCFQQAERIDPYWFKYLLHFSYCNLKLGRKSEFLLSLKDVIRNKHYIVFSLIKELNNWQLSEIVSELEKMAIESNNSDAVLIYNVLKAFVKIDSRQNQRDVKKYFSFLHDLKHQPEDLELPKNPYENESFLDDLIQFKNPDILEINSNELPKDFSFFIQSIWKCYFLKEYDAALKFINAAIEINITKSIYFFYRARFKELHEYDDFSDDSFSIIRDDVLSQRLNPIEKEYHKYFEKGEYYDLIIEKYPTRAKYYFERGVCYLNFVHWQCYDSRDWYEPLFYNWDSKKLVIAKNSFSKAVEIEPSNAEYIYYKGYSMFKFAAACLCAGRLWSHDLIFMASEIIQEAINLGYKSNFFEEEEWRYVLREAGYLEEEEEE